MGRRGPYKSEETRQRALEAGRRNLSQPGMTNNPGGKPKGARNRLQGSFLNALADDFEKHGKKAIELCRKDDPTGYLRVIAALMPKEVELHRPLDDLTDEQIEAAIAAARALASASDPGSGKGAKARAKPAARVPAVPQAG